MGEDKVMNPFAKNQQPSKAGGDDLFTDLLVHNSNTKPKVNAHPNLSPPGGYFLAVSSKCNQFHMPPNLIDLLTPDVQLFVFFSDST